MSRVAERQGEQDERQAATAHSPQDTFVGSQEPVSPAPLQREKGRPKNLGETSGSGCTRDDIRRSYAPDRRGPLPRLRFPQEDTAIRLMPDADNGEAD